MAVTSNLERKKLEKYVNNKINSLTDSLTRKEIINVNNNTPFFYKFLLTDKNTEWSTINSNLTEDFNYISEYEAVLPYENSGSYKNDWNYHPIFTRLHVYKNENIVLNEILLLDLSDLTNGNQKLKLIENVYNFGSNSINFSFKSLNNDGYYELDFTGNDISLNANTTISYSAQTAATIHLTNDANYNKILLSENTAIASEALSTNSSITLYGVINDEFDNETFEDILDLVEGIVSGVEYKFPSRGIDFSFLNNRIANNSVASGQYSSLYNFVLIGSKNDNMGVYTISPELDSITPYQRWQSYSGWGSSRAYPATKTLVNGTVANAIASSSNPNRRWKQLVDNTNYSNQFYIESNRPKFITKINDAGSYNCFGTNFLKMISKKSIDENNNLYWIEILDSDCNIQRFLYFDVDYNESSTGWVTTNYYYKVTPNSRSGYSFTDSNCRWEITSGSNYINLQAPAKANVLYKVNYIEGDYDNTAVLTEVKDYSLVLFIDNTYCNSWTNPNGEGNIEEILKGAQTNTYFKPDENSEAINELKNAPLKEKVYDNSNNTITYLKNVIEGLTNRIAALESGNINITATVTTSGYFDIKMAYFKDIKWDSSYLNNSNITIDLSNKFNMEALANFEIYKVEVDYNEDIPTSTLNDYSISDTTTNNVRSIVYNSSLTSGSTLSLTSSDNFIDEIRIYFRTIDNTVVNNGGE